MRSAERRGSTSWSLRSMAASASTLAGELDRSLAHLTDTARRALQLEDDGKLEKRQLEDALGGIAVLAHAEVEGFIERLFTGLMAGAVRPSNRSRVRPLIRAKSYLHARSIILGRDASNDYIAWLPYRRTIEHAERLLRSGRPFSEMSEPAETALYQLHYVRNALAHSSDKSQADFMKHCVRDLNLPSWQRRPGGFLRGPHSGGKSRIEHYLGELRIGVTALGQQ